MVVKIVVDVMLYQFYNSIMIFVGSYRMIRFPSNAPASYNALYFVTARVDTFSISSSLFTLRFHQSKYLFRILLPHPVLHSEIANNRLLRMAESSQHHTVFLIPLFQRSERPSFVHCNKERHTLEWNLSPLLHSVTAFTICR